MRHEPKTYAALLIALAVLLISPAAYAVTALEEWNAAARDALATPVKVWLGLMMLTNIAAIEPCRGPVGVCRLCHQPRACHCHVGSGYGSPRWASLTVSHYLLDTGHDYAAAPSK